MIIVDLDQTTKAVRATLPGPARDGKPPPVRDDQPPRTRKLPAARSSVQQFWERVTGGDIAFAPDPIRIAVDDAAHAAYRRLQGDDQGGHQRMLVWSVPWGTVFRSVQPHNRRSRDQHSRAQPP